MVVADRTDPSSSRASVGPTWPMKPPIAIDAAMKPEEANQRRTLVDEEIADDVLVVGEDAIGGNELDEAEVDQVEDTDEESGEDSGENAAETDERQD